MFKEVNSDCEFAMNESIEHLHRDLGGIRTGKANPGLLDSLRVDYFGQQVPIIQVASIAVPDARLITIQPWDKTVIGEIEKAILASELGLNPQNDGTLIRLPIPQLTEERRRDLAKLVKRLGEDAKVSVRNARRDGNEHLKKLEKQHDISEDQMHTTQDDIQKMTDQFIKKVDDILQSKEKEIMEI